MLENWHLLLSIEKDLAFCYSLKNKERSHLKGLNSDSMRRVGKNKRREKDIRRFFTEAPLAGHDLKSSAEEVVIA